MFYIQWVIQNSHLAKVFRAVAMKDNIQMKILKSWSPNL